MNTTLTTANTSTLAALLTPGEIVEMDGELVRVTQVHEYNEMSEHFDCVLILGIDVETGRYIRTFRVYAWQEIETFSGN